MKLFVLVFALLLSTRQNNDGAEDFSLLAPVSKATNLGNVNEVRRAKRFTKSESRSNHRN